jgi:hypothetical protein
MMPSRIEIDGVALGDLGRDPAHVDAVPVRGPDDEVGEAWALELARGDVEADPGQEAALAPVGELTADLVCVTP